MADYSPWDRKESDTVEYVRAHTHTTLATSAIISLELTFSSKVKITKQNTF